MPVHLPSRQIFPILLVNFIGSLGYSIVLPFLVILVVKYGGNEVVYGFIGATYSFFQLLGAPILGNWSDSIGRRKVLIISQAGTFLAWCLFLFAMSLPITELLESENAFLGSFILTLPLLLLFVARALDGITGGNVSVANAYLADISTKEDRKKNFGMMSASGNLGFIIGPALAGILGTTVLGDKLPVLLALAISFIAIFVIFFFLENRPCKELKEPTDVEKTRKILGQEHKECHNMDPKGSKLITILRLPGIATILVIYFLVFLAFNFFYVAFPIHATQFLEWDLFKLGLFFTVMSGVMVFVQGPILGRLSKRVNDWTLFVVGNLILAGGFSLFTSAQDIWLFTAVVLFALGNGLMWPSFLSIIAERAGDEYQGAVQGFASSAGSLASIVGLVLGGLVYQQMGASIFFISVGVFLLICIYTQISNMLSLSKK